MMYPFSVHVFLYYNDTGPWLLNKLKEFYSGPIYLSLANDNPNNEELISTARSLFDVSLTYVNNVGNDQIGFYNTVKKDKLDSPWILYLHDKHIDKKQWLEELINPLKELNKKVLENKSIGIISAASHKNKVFSIHEIVTNFGAIDFHLRKNIVQNMHTVIWLKELQRILLEKHKLIKEDAVHPEFCAGNIFLARREIVKTAHDCVYNDFFSNCYSADGDVAHGLERFYFYVSECLNYKNLFI